MNAVGEWPGNARYELRQMTKAGLPSLLISRHRMLHIALGKLARELEGDRLEMFVVDRLAPRPPSVPETEFVGVVVATGRENHCTGCLCIESRCSVLWPEQRKCCPDCSHGGGL